MPTWNRKSKLTCAIFAIVAYFSLAARSIHSYVDFTPKGKIVFRIYRPYEKFGDSKLAAIAHEWTQVGSLNDIADSADNNQRSPILIYEDDRLLGPPHSEHADIANLGMGRYSHWKGQGYVFSASDNSDPNLNRRSYWVVIPY